MINVVLSVMVLAVFALLLGAFALWRRGGPIKQVLLMVLLAIIAIVNVGIWTIPDAEGDTPLGKIDKIDGSVG